MLNTLLLRLSLFFIIFVSGCAEKTSLQSHILTGQTMGTTYSIKYFSDKKSHDSFASAKLHNEVEQLLKDINQLMSTYIQDSELSLINKAQAGIPMPVSAETRYVIDTAIQLHELSEGMLDITVGPLVNLWGFGPQSKPVKLPTQEQLQEISQYVGIDKFYFEENTIVKTHPSVYIDLSTIAKGYAVDRLGQLLSDHNIEDFMVEVGGELLIRGNKPYSQAWIIAVEKPVSTERAIQESISVVNQAIATSGDYRNYFEQDGVRYSHLLDPLTAKPIQHNLVAVTVVADTAIMADGLATALNVLGKERGLVIAEQNNIAAMFITKENEQFKVYTTQSFDKRVTTY